MNVRLVFTALFALTMLGCGSGDPSDLLSDYIDGLGGSEQGSDVIACAASEIEEEVSIFMYVEPGAYDIRYYEASGADADPSDLASYSQTVLERESVLVGPFQRFVRPGGSGNTWGRVTYRTNGFVHVSQPIRIRQNSQPTEYLENVVSVEFVEDQVAFSWEPVPDGTNAIYFQMISDYQRNLISGTYTYDKAFTFYDPSNVVLRVTSDDPVPVLAKDQDYTFTLMGVSTDNWVNVATTKTFRLER